VSVLDTLRGNGVEDLLPGGLEQQLRDLGITEDSSTTTGDVTVIRATVAGLSDRGLPQLGTLPVEAPGLTSGLRMQLAVRKPGGGPVTEWALDLDLDRIAVVVPGLRPARERREPARATRLEDEPGRTAVRVVGRGVLRIAASGGGTPAVTLIDRLDSTDPFGPHGPVATLTFEPPSFFIGASSFGMTVEELTYDQSTSLSPAPKPPDWRGLALRRAILYLPPGAPFLGDISLGVQDVFLGDPVGVEGTAFLEFGGAADTPLALLVEQETAPGTWTPLAVAMLAGPGERQDRVTAALTGQQPPAARVRARLTTPPIGSVTWRLPGGQGDPNGFDVQPGDSLEVRVDLAPPTTCAFVGTWTAPPTVDLTLGGATWANVTSVSGTAADLAGAAFARSTEAGGPYAWGWDDGAEVSTPTVAVPASVGTHALQLRKSGRAVRHVRVEIRLAGPVLVGCRAGTFTTGAGPTGTAVAVVDVSGTYGLTAWHAGGVLARGLPAATVAAGAATVAQGTVAEVVTATTSGTGTPPPAPSTAPVETHSHVRFVFDSGELSPAGTVWIGDAQQSLSRLQAWVDSLGSTAKFAVVGRCDDLNRNIPLTDTSDSYNRALAVRRANAARDLLVAAGVASSRIAVRGEQSSWSGPAPAPSTGTLPADATTVAWKARATPEYRSWDRPYPNDDVHRTALRRGDIYAYDVTPAPTATPPAQDANTLDPARLRALVPGADPATVTGAIVPSTPRGRPQYRVRIEVEWNDPTAAGLGDAVPIRAEVTIQWPGTAAQLPPAAGGGGTVPITRPGETGAPPVWTLRGRWAHDRSAGSDDFTLALDVAGNSTGIAQIENRFLAAALGLAPAVIGAAGSPAGAEAALVGALIGAIGGAVGSLLRPTSKTTVTGITINHLARGPSGPGSRTRLTVDYTVELSVDVAQAGLPLRVSTRPDKPMKLRYRGVGVEIDTAAANWWEGVGLTVGNVVPEVVDPGSWQLGAPLDDLLRVTGTRAGSQSSWLEVDLALSLDLGVVTLSNATVRVVFGPGGVQGVELRGLRAGVDIPATLRGEGALSISGGTISAGLQLEIIPLKVGALANLTMGPAGFVELTVAVRFPAPIPFANSGLGLFGVIGRFVSNGERDVVPNPDPIQRELGWLAKPAPKYRSQPGQYALGLGATIGTVPDLGFTFHAMGMVTVEFPRPAVIFAIIAKVIDSPAPVPSDEVGRPGHGLSIIGLVVIDNTAVSIALRGHYEIPGILVLDVPVAAWFPYAQPTASFVHVGTDNQPGREGAPVTLTLLPDVLDVRVWAFVMVHGNGISPGLQGNADFVFGGFAIGFGAGWEINWSAGPIKLEASATVLAGFGTSPRFLAAGIWVRGSLDLVILSISARGEITLKTDGNRTDLHGRFCGEVDCFFFSISGCVEINVSATLGTPDPPPSPTTGVDLVARRGHAAAAAVTSGAAPVVWPDAIPVIHFVHTVENAVSGGDFKVGTAMPGPVWSGSRDLKHAFRLTGVRLEPTSGPPFTPPAGTQFDTAWWWPGVRSTAKPPWLSANESEPRDLALLSWEPWTGLLPLTEPAGSPGDPGPVIGDLCDPVSRPEPVCVLGALGRPSGPGAAVLPQDPAEVTPGAVPARLHTTQPGDRPWVAVVAAAMSAGVAVQPAGLAPLDIPTPLATGPVRTAGWRLASFVRGGQELGALGLWATFDPALSDPTLVLEVCPVPIRDKDPRPVAGSSACVDFGDLDPDTLPQFLTEEERVLRYRGLMAEVLGKHPMQTVDFDGDGRWALLLLSSGLRFHLPAPASEVTVTVVSRQDWKVIAFDGDGREVAGDGAGTGATLTLAGKGITTIEVYGEGEGGVAEVCVPGADPAGASGAVLAWQPGREDRLTPPDVVGILPGGGEEPWKPSLKVGRRCATVVYRAPETGPWTGFKIAPAPGRRVTVVGSCGVRWHEELEVRQAEEHRNDVLSSFISHASGVAGTVLGTVTASAGVAVLPVAPALAPPPRPLLRPGTQYRVSVSWEWQRWERSASSSQPGAPDPNGWQAGGTDVYQFRTPALAALSTPAPPVDLVGETTFEPRQTARYVTGAQPSGALPHLLDDPIRVTFSVDYFAKLLDGYGFDARVEVRPSDVDPGTVPPGSHPASVVSGLSIKAWQADAVLLPVESRVVDAVSAAPCAPDTSLGGTAVEVLAALEPEKAYDLLLVAHPRAGGADVVVSRWHFRTSRWRDVEEILRVLELPAGTPSPVTPEDVLLQGQWPALAAAPHDDSAFDAALAAIGLDPWPLSPRPRTTTLWVPPDPAAGRTAWALAGLLLEAPEPIARRGRIAVSGSVGGVALAHLRSTANGTRVLLALASVVVPGPNDAVAVRLVDSLRGRTANGAAQLLGGPRTIRREVSG
jgi:outer membrane protein OmpA-like peptidoglycan-associated protein